MILNRLIMTEGNTLHFHVNHKVNGVDYVLKTGEKYYMAITSESDPDNVIFNCFWKNDDFSMKLPLTEGMYLFEICLDTGSNREVIIPALDERHRPLNQLIVLRRLSDY